MQVFWKKTESCEATNHVRLRNDTNLCNEEYWEIAMIEDICGDIKVVYVERFWEFRNAVATLIMKGVIDDVSDIDKQYIRNSKDGYDVMAWFESCI